jgi:DNA-binding YbaB/EbfC family protein
MSDFSSLQGLFEAAQRIQVEMVRVKAELGDKTVSAETGGGLCTCTANGKGEVTSLAIDPSLLGGLGADGKKMVEDLVVGAVNLALDRARQLAQEEVVRATGGLPLPPGLFGG